MRKLSVNKYYSINGVAELNTEQARWHPSRPAHPGHCVVLWRTAKNVGGQSDKQELRTVVPTSWLNEARTTCRWPTFDSDENRLRNYIMKDKPLTKGQ